jgi:hypothetical protein
MLPIEMPDQTGWDGEIHHVCFNDECEYYKKSWGVLRRQGGYQTGYRCRLSPRGSYEAQLVWGPDALKDKIREYKFIKDVFGPEPDTLTPLLALALDLPDDLPINGAFMEALKNKICAELADPDDWPINTEPPVPHIESIHQQLYKDAGVFEFGFSDGSMVTVTTDQRILFFDKEDNEPVVIVPAGELVEWLRSKK